jgi:hypothetical protein
MPAPGLGRTVDRMRCDFCGRQSIPDERGWLTILAHWSDERPTHSSTYCPDCVAGAVQEPDAEGEGE